MEIFKCDPYETTFNPTKILKNIIQVKKYKII